VLTLRSRTDIEAEYERAVATLANGTDPRLNPQLERHANVVATAIADALSWVLGYTDEAPWTRRLLPNPTPQQLFSEWAKAETVNHDTRLMHDDQERFWYGSAVEHALAWARGSDTNAPTHEGW
jgi:hypothetical protein